MMSNQDLVMAKNGKATLSFHEGQTKAWESEKRFTFVVAGTQSGKTSFSLVHGGWSKKSKNVARAITLLLPRLMIYSSLNYYQR